MVEKSPDAFRTISEVAEDLDVPQHVLRFWEGKFNQVKPMKRAGGRRYYRPNDLELLRGIRHLLYGEGYTIKGVQRILREQGAAYVTEAGRTKSLPVSAESQAVAPPAPVPMEQPVSTPPVAAQPAEVPPVRPAEPVQAGVSAADRQALASILQELHAVRGMLASNIAYTIAQ